MAKFGDSGELLKCSFCGKSQKQVKKLIAERRQVYDQVTELIQVIKTGRPAA